MKYDAVESLALSGQESVHADIIALLRERAMEEEGTRLAFVFLGDGETETAHLTFGELDRRARAIAVRLLEVTEAGERALLLYPPGLDFITAFFGCLYAGIVAVPANPPSRQHLHRLRSVVEDAAPAIVMTTVELREQFETRSAQSWSRDKLLWLVADGQDLAVADQWMRPPITPESLAFLQYTSGSTGVPKGVMVSHRNLLSNEAVIKSAFGHDRHSTVVGWLPLYHDMGLIGTIIQPLFVGSTAILMPPFAFLEKPLRWLRAIAKYKARTSGGPNFAYELCLRQVLAADKQDLDLTSWTLAFNGSEMVRASTLNRFAAAFAECGFRHEAFFPCYGLAEATLFASGVNRGRGLIVKRFNKAALSQGLAIAEIDSLDENECIVACGHCGSGHHLKIVDPETRNICPDGRIGEIWFAGPSVAQGYWGQPGETEQIFRARTAGREAKPYLRTGDLGFVDGGQLFIAGRIKDLIIIRGANYYASDFERILDQGVPGLRAGCNTAFAVERENQEVLILVAEAKRDYLRINGAATIFQAVRAVVAREYPLAIGEIVLVPPGAVPKTSSGKIRRRACRQAYLDGVLRILAVTGEEIKDSPEPVREMRQAFVTPSGSTEEESRTVSDVLRFLCVEIARILCCSESEIQMEKSLAELGLDSLQTVGLKHGVDAFLEIDLPLDLLLAENSLSTLAKEIAALPPTTRLPVSSSATGLSYTQRALWTVHRLDQNSISYNLHLALDVAGELDTETLSSALAYILQRHEQLRTSYRDDNGRLGQAVEPFAELTEWFSLVDASGWNGAALQADIGAHARQHFDLERGPPLRVTLYRQGHNKTTLLFCAHHIAIDLWSLLLLIQEIEESYRELQSGLACKTTPAPRYADFIVWQNNYLESSLATRDFEYWKTQLDRQLPILALPTDFPRPSGSDYCGASHALRLDPDFTATLKALASHHGVSFSTLLLAIYQVLLHRYSGQCEMVVGVPGSGRLRGEFARLVGNCVNPIAIVGRLLPALSFTEFLRQLGERVRDGLVHQNFPFPMLVERLHPERQSDHWPIYQTSFVLQQTQEGLPRDMALLALGEENPPFIWCGCEAAILPLQKRVENFDLKLMAAESENGLVLSFQYRTELFLPATIARMAGHFSALAAGIVASPETRIGELPLLTEAERHSLLVERNATAHGYSHDACVHELFAAQAGMRPGAIAVSFGEQQLTYAELDEQTNQLAHYLRGRGVGPDVVVGLCVERSLEMVVGILGILKAGGGYLPLDPEYPEERLAYMAADAKPRLLLTQTHLVPSLPKHMCVFCLDKDWNATASASRRNLTNKTLPLNLAYVIYTSGSTGKPKGVAVTHGGLVNRLEWMRTYFDVGETDAVLQKTPYGFDVSAWELFLPLLAGGRLIVARPGDHHDPARLTDIIERKGVTIVHFVPSMLQAFLDDPALQALSTLRGVICSGEALSSRLRDQFYAGQPAELYNLYGPTEASIDVTAHACGKGGEEAGVAIGRPIWNTQIYVLDKEYNPVPLGIPGELYIGGIGLARGYMGRPGLTAERFVPDLFGMEGGRLYRTGDLARLRADGSLEYLGRTDHQVKLRGFRIELGEIEAHLLEHPAVRAAVVTMREVGDRKSLAAYVVRVPDVSLDSDVLGDWLQRSLPDYMIPSDFVWLDVLPLTSHGKLDRNALPAPEARAEIADYVPPQTREEELLAGVWKEVLGLERVGVTDNFFALGGDSILSIQVASRVRAAGFDLTPRRVFLHPALGTLASQLQPLTTTASIPAMPLVKHFVLAELPEEQVEKLRGEFAELVDLYPLTPMQEGMLFHCLLHPGSGIYVLQDQYEIRGRVDIEAFHGAWQHAVDRHDILRSAMVWRQVEKPHQRVQHQATLPFIFENYRGLTNTEQEKRLADVLETERRDGIDLERPPLMRIRLIRLGEDRWRCVRSHHHILTDEWCTSPLFVEFRDAYAALLMGRPLPERRVYQFRDYFAWLKHQDLAVPEAFWRSYLRGFREPTPLIVDRSRRARDTMQDNILDAEAELDRGSTLALQQVAQKYGVTPNTLIQGAFALLLGRYANRPEVVFGITVSGRPAELPGIEQMLGLFINTLPLRLRFREAQRISDWWQEIQSVNLELRQFEFTPLVQCQAWSEVAGGIDLFQHLLVFENAPVDPSLLTDRSVLNMRFIGNRVHTNYPITVTVIPGDKLHVRITYEANRFEQPYIQRFLTHFLALLEAMIARPQGHVGEFSLLLPAERRQQLRQWNDTAHTYAPPADFVAAFEARVELCPDARAVRCGEVSFSYRELNRRVNKVAHGLIARGVGPEIVVGVIDERGVDFLVMMLAVLKAGGVYLPLDPRHPKLRHLRVIQESGVALVLTGRTWLSELRELCEGGVVIVESHHELEQATAEWNPPRDAKAGNLAYIVHTSGSTGTPKGAMVERLGMFNNLMTKIPALDLGPEDVIAQTASQAFDISIWQFLTALICGACIDILPDAVAQDPFALSAALHDRGITILESVPAMIRAMLDVSVQTMPPKRLRWLLPTGEALPPDLCRSWFARYPGIPMLNAYGPAECADDVAYHRIEAAPGAGTFVMPIGRPVANVRLYILDRHMELAPAGVLGELCVAGMGVGRGYARRPDLTAAAFWPDPFGSPGDRLYRTGDLARYCDDGTIEFHGRADDQVKIRGHRIEIGEIEAQLRRHPEVKDAAAMAWPDAKFGYRLVGYFVPQAKEGTKPETLSAFLRDWLPDYMVPAVWIELSALPLNPNGKLDRKSLPKPTNLDPGQGFQAPTTPTEQILAGLWGGILSRDCVGRHDNFFELGGHSLLATQAIARSNQTFCMEAPLRALFEAPTIAGFAVYVDATRRLGKPSPPLLIPAPCEGPLPLSHAQQRLWFMQQLDPTNPLYHFAVAIRIAGPFDANLFEASLNAIVHRHESLRTVFREEWGELRQEILLELPVKLESMVVQSDSEEMFTSGLPQWMRETAAAPFDLTNGPLMRATLYRPQSVQQGTPSVCAVLLCFHHIVFDGWSFGVFLKEFAALYSALKNGDEPSLPRLPAQYADYVVWQSDRMQSALLVRQRDYWTGQLKGAPLLLQLPVDYPRSADTSDTAGSYEFDLTGLRTALDGFDRQHAVTPFMTILAAFAGLLRYLSGASDLLVGADIANRQRREFESLIGFFINLVAMRIKLDGDPSFSELLARVREVTLGAYDHQDFPFEKLVEALRPERSPLHAAIFQVKLVFHNVPLTELDLQDLTFETIPFEPLRTELDLVLHVYEDHQRLRAVFEYRTGLFEAASISKFAELMRLLLQTVLAEPSVRLSTLMKLLAEQDRAIRDSARSEQLAQQLDRLQAAKRRSVKAEQ